jgi:hypothetical protein
MHRIRAKLLAAAAVAGLLTVGGGAALAGGGDDKNGDHKGSSKSSFRAVLIGYEEVPAVSTTGSGAFKARISADGTEVRWKLSYRDLEAPVQAAHVHFGQRKVNGGVSAFLCSNLPDPPAGTQPCPPAPAKITGTIEAEDVIGPVDQGIEPGALGELAAAMQAGVTYANVHTDKFPNGEIRGQIAPRRHHHDH